MTVTFATNEKNDLYVGEDGNLAMLRGLPAVVNLCQAIAEAQRGEMVLDTQRGIPNFQALWNGNPNIPQFTAALQLALQSIADVTRVSAIETARTGNTLQYRVTITTKYGQSLISGFLNGI